MLKSKTGVTQVQMQNLVLLHFQIFINMQSWHAEMTSLNVLENNDALNWCVCNVIYIGLDFAYQHTETADFCAVSLKLEIMFRNRYRS